MKNQLYALALPLVILLFAFFPQRGITSRDYYRFINIYHFIKLLDILLAITLLILDFIFINNEIVLIILMVVFVGIIAVVESIFEYHCSKSITNDLVEKIKEFDYMHMSDSELAWSIELKYYADSKMNDDYYKLRNKYYDIDLRELEENRKYDSDNDYYHLFEQYDHYNEEWYQNRDEPKDGITVFDFDVAKAMKVIFKNRKEDKKIRDKYLKEKKAERYDVSDSNHKGKKKKKKNKDIEENIEEDIIDDYNYNEDKLNDYNYDEDKLDDCNYDDIDDEDYKY